MTRASILRPAEFASFPKGRELLRAVMENAPIGMSLVALDGRTIYINQAFATMFRRSREAMLGLTIGEMVAPEMLDEARRQAEATLAGGLDGYRAERLYLRGDGSVFWGLIAVSAVRPEEGAGPDFFITQIVDIDSEKRAETAIAEAESRWNFALESAGQGVWDHDLRSGKSFFSRSWKRMRGLDPDAPLDYSQESWLERVHPDDRTFSLIQEHKLTEGKADYHEFEYRERLPDGRYIWILSRGRPVEWNPDGSVARVIGTDTDVTRIKATETQLSEVIATMADAVALFDTEERLIYCNEQYPRLFPATPDIRVAGTRLVDILRASVAAGEVKGYTTENGEAYVDLTRRSLRAGGDWEIEMADGRWLHARARIVADGGGHLSVMTDITDRKRNELAQAEVNRRLSELANVDGLTGLINRRAYDELIAAEFDRSRRERRAIALLVIDVDYFKPFNDAYGHPVGDDCLRSVAKVLAGSIRRPGDRAARIGGEEFAVILPDTDRAGALAVAETIRSSVRALAIRHERSPMRVLTVSVGVATFDGESGAVESQTELLAQADEALYAAKGSGRDRALAYDAETKTAGGDPPAAVDGGLGDGI